MIKRCKKTLALTSIITVLPILFGLLVWEQLPESMVTHWGFDGMPDGWSSRPFAVIGLPLILLAFHWVCVFATQADPKNKEGNSKIMKLVLWICPLVSLLCGAMTYGAAFGIAFNANRIMPPLTGVLFITLGNYLPKCSQNYTIGVKIPWTLNSTENWNRTHRFAGRLWVIGGLCFLLIGLLPNPKLVLVVALPSILLLALLPMLYSYLYYRKHERTN